MVEENNRGHAGGGCLTTDDLRNLVVISDLHGGCRLALHPRGPSNLDDGGTYRPSRFQLHLHDRWDEFWEWVRVVARGEPYGVLVNGDVVDGVHHNSTTQISHNIQDQFMIARALLEPVVERCGGRFWMTRGTAAHVGSSSVYEEQVAKALGAIPNKDGQHARWRLKLNLSGRLIVAEHHVGATSSHAYLTSAPWRRLTEALVNEAKSRSKSHVAVKVFSHRHTHVRAAVDGAGGPIWTATTPGWQGPTPFTYRIGGMLPEVGGIFIRVVKTSQRVTDTGEEPVTVKARVWQLGEDD